jgi:hypothetical protein
VAARSESLLTPATRARLAELRRRSAAGTLTSDERQEYARIVAALFERPGVHPPLATR